MMLCLCENLDARFLTFVEEGLYAHGVRITIHVKGDGPARIGQCNSRGHSEPRRRRI